MWYFSIILTVRKPQLNLHLLTCSSSRKARPWIGNFSGICHFSEPRANNTILSDRQLEVSIASPLIGQKTYESEHKKTRNSFDLSFDEKEFIAEIMFSKPQIIINFIWSEGILFYLSSRLRKLRQRDMICFDRCLFDEFIIILTEIVDYKLRWEVASIFGSFNKDKNIIKLSATQQNEFVLSYILCVWLGKT